ncbi:hypothetical protein KKD62_03820 [Patescibacteria group bacterium]|nr:hypothetical protein [Patescibacteria group bacterium]MBU1931134.1 hypothetical protein [Patescibacteria group bacterium]
MKRLAVTSRLIIEEALKRAEDDWVGQFNPEVTAKLVTALNQLVYRDRIAAGDWQEIEEILGIKLETGQKQALARGVRSMRAVKKALADAFPRPSETEGE